MSTLAIIVLTLAAMADGHLQPPAPRHVTVNVVVHTDTGDPIPGLKFGTPAVEGVNVGTLTTPAYLAAAKSDSTGHMVITATIDATKDKLFFRLCDAPLAEMSREERLADRAAFKLVRDGFQFKPYYPLDLVSGTDTYSLEVVAPRAISVDGRLLHADRSPASGSITVRGGATVEMVRPDGTFTLGGVAKNQVGELFAMTDHQVIPIHVPVSPNNLALGDVILSDPTPTATLHITIPDWPSFHASHPEKVFGGVTLIASDGSSIWTFLLRDTTVVGDARATAPKVPPGTYFVVPGAFTGDGLPLRVLDAVRSSVDLGASGVPSLVATAGAEVTSQVSAVSAGNAISALPGN